MPPKRNKVSQPSISQKKKQKLSQTRTTKWDQMLPPPPENQEPTAQSNISDMSSILNRLENTESQISQRVSQTQQPEEPLSTCPIDEPVIEEVQTLVSHPLMGNNCHQPENTQNQILDMSKFPDYAYSIPSGRARSG